MFLLSLQEDEKFLSSLFSQLTDDETDDEKRRELVLFLKEFCTFSQTLQPQNRDSFFKVKFYYSFNVSCFLCKHFAIFHVYVNAYLSFLSAYPLFLYKKVVYLFSFNLSKIPIRVQNYCDLRTKII